MNSPLCIFTKIGSIIINIIIIIAITKIWHSSRLLFWWSCWSPHGSLGGNYQYYSVLLCISIYLSFVFLFDFLLMVLLIIQVAPGNPAFTVVRRIIVFICIFCIYFFKFYMCLYLYDLYLYWICTLQHCVEKNHISEWIWISASCSNSCFIKVHPNFRRFRELYYSQWKLKFNFIWKGFNLLFGD